MPITLWLSFLIVKCFLSKYSSKSMACLREIFNNSLDIPLPEEQFRQSTIKSISKELTKRGLTDEQ